MKNGFFVLGLALLILSPVYALAGTAVIPIVHVDPVAADYLVTDVHIKNISNIPQRITLTLYNSNGTPAANRPLGSSNAEVVSFPTTNANGEVTVDVQGLNSLYFVVYGTSTLLDGWGKITSTMIPGSGSGTGYVVAQGLLRNMNIYGGFSTAIVINGGMPF